MTGAIEEADWPIFGWDDDIRPALREAMNAGRPAVLATLYRVEGSAPRGPGAQMLFDGNKASGYFSGDCIEGDVASHAAEVMADGKPRHLHYGLGSPWIDIRLRCGGALYVFVERIEAHSNAAAAVLEYTEKRQPCLWSSDGTLQKAAPGEGPVLTYGEAPFCFTRRFDPPRRLVVSGGDPGALAVARMGMLAGFETILIRPDGPETPPPFPVSRYMREEPADALARLGLDKWTAYVGATHEDHHDLGGCLHALRHGAAYVGMIGARSRAEGRLAALRAAGASDAELERLELSPGIRGLGKAPWDVATGIVAAIMAALTSANKCA
ncbi:MAG: XdhC family protein [Sphingomonadaceae bacterium]|nr:XdhC family protein [Sphingomonadaceae bacterium]